MDLTVLDGLHICACCIGLFICGPVASSDCVCVCVCWVDCSWVCLLDLYRVNNSRVCLLTWLSTRMPMAMIIQVCFCETAYSYVYLLVWLSMYISFGLKLTCISMWSWLFMCVSIVFFFHTCTCGLTFHASICLTYHSSCRCMSLSDGSSYLCQLVCPFMCMPVGLIIYVCFCWVDSPWVCLLGWLCVHAEAFLLPYSLCELRNPQKHIRV